MKKIIFIVLSVLFCSVFVFSPYLAVSKETSGTKHGDIRQRMKEAELAYYKTCIDIEIVFSETEIPLIEEYFPDSIIEKLPSRKCKTHIHAPAKERLWKALLLSFGNAVTVVSPKDYKEGLIKTAQSFLSNYGRNLLGTMYLTEIK